MLWKLTMRCTYYSREHASCVEQCDKGRNGIDKHRQHVQATLQTHVILISRQSEIAAQQSNGENCDSFLSSVVNYKQHTRRRCEGRNFIHEADLSA